MSRGTLGRIERIEQQRAKAVPPLVEWEDDDGVIVYLDSGLTHEEALKLLD